jgi:hypothetical protein
LTSIERELEWISYQIAEIQDQLQTIWEHLPDEYVSDAGRAVASISCLRVSLQLRLAFPPHGKRPATSPRPASPQPARELSAPD